MRSSAFAILFIGLGFAGVIAAGEPKHRLFGRLPDGRPVEIYTWHTGALDVEVTNYGGRIVSVRAPDREGHFQDVVLGFGSLDGYLTENNFFGAIIGRYANRIDHGRFILDGRTYHLTQNGGDVSIHGGRVGFAQRLWKGHAKDGSLVLTYTSPGGEEGYPGTLTATVRYTVRHNEIRIDYRATTDADTILNFTNHTFFNLAGAGNATVLAHEILLNADRYTPVDGRLVPTGAISKVEGTPFDFRTPHPIGEHIEDPALRATKGFDQNWVIDHSRAGLTFAARVLDPGSGRTLEVFTTEPGVQFYTANHLDGSLTSADGKHYDRFGAFCLETQHFPDSPNHPNFPSTVLKPGRTFHSVTLFRFFSTPARSLNHRASSSMPMQPGPS
jgi:aldose 1-epimerase